MDGKKDKGPRENSTTGTNRYLREEYLSRINRVIDHIDANLCGELRLKKLASIAHFSPYHFHRIFKALVGEPLNQFIQRIRVERAATKLVDQPKQSVTDIALDCGFSSSSAFARVFKNHFSMSATEWRRKCEEHMGKIRKENSKNGQRESKGWKDNGGPASYIESISRSRRHTMPHTKSISVDVSEVPEMHVAYVRHIGPYKGDSELFGRLFNKLFTWAGARNLINVPETKVMAMYHDSPEITDENKLRTSVCITIPEHTKIDGEVGEMIIPGGTYAIGHFEIDDNGFEDAWNYMYGSWLPESGYQPDDRPSLEQFKNDPKEHPEGKHIVDIYVPVKPL
jgi:AraC family transcriptional regulator